MAGPVARVICPTGEYSLFLLVMRVLRSIICSLQEIIPSLVMGVFDSL